MKTYVKGNRDLCLLGDLEKPAMTHSTMRFCYKADDASTLLYFIAHLFSFGTSNFRTNVTEIYAQFFLGVFLLI